MDRSVFMRLCDVARSAALLRPHNRQETGAWR